MPSCIGRERDVADTSFAQDLPREFSVSCGGSCKQRVPWLEHRARFERRSGHAHSCSDKHALIGYVPAVRYFECL